MQSESLCMLTELAVFAVVAGAVAETLVAIPLLRAVAVILARTPPAYVGISNCKRQFTVY